MICETVEELTPIIGTRPACRALGASPATIYRRRRPPRAEAAEAAAGAAQGVERTGARGGTGGAALGAVRGLRA